jgi:hypothetical protein
MQLGQDIIDKANDEKKRLQRIQKTVEDGKKE